MSIHILCPFLNWIIYFFIMELLGFFILDTISLSHILFANIFSCSVDCLSLPYGIICSTFLNFGIYQIFCLLPVLLVSNLNTLPNPRSYFFSRSFFFFLIVLALLNLHELQLRDSKNNSHTWSVIRMKWIAYTNPPGT